MIRLSHITKTFGDTCVVDDQSLSILPGDVFGLYGNPGPGKTTFLMLIAGLLIPQSGSIRIFKKSH